MISIKEIHSNKVVGESSLLIEARYNERLVSALRECEGSYYDKKSHKWEVPLIYLSQLLDVACLVDDVEVKLLDYTKPAPFDPNSIDISNHTFRTHPFNYQLDGIKYGITHNKWLLLDPPGLGKTLSALYIAQILRERGKVEHCLIICGINSLKNNWRKEVQKHSYLDCTILGERVTKTGKHVIGSIADRVSHLKKHIDEFYIITNIETLRSKEVVEALKSKKFNNINMCVLDEAHVCKNPGTQQGSNLLKLSNTFDYMLAMTGTLLLNNPLDAYVPLRLVQAENATYTNFKNYYGKYVGERHNILIGFKNLDTLKDTIENYSLRRSKDLLNLPSKTVIDEYVDMNDAQALLYDNVREGIRESVNKVILRPANILALTSRLRQVTACPSILTTENISSAKIERACDLAIQIISNGSKVVIFSTFKETVAKLAEALAEYAPLICTGDILDAQISDNIEEFQNNPNRNLFIATWQKCGTGITLTAANYEIFIDTPYTAGAFEQAQDRCYRIGTTKNLIIYNLITTGTVDEKVRDIVERKGAVSDYVLDDKLTDDSLNILKEFIEAL